MLTLNLFFADFKGYMIKKSCFLDKKYYHLNTLILYLCSVIKKNIAKFQIFNANINCKN